MSYSGTSDWDNIFENVEDYWEGTGSETLINNVATRAFRNINSQLEAINVAVPVGTISDGGYDQALTDWESNWSVYYLLVRRHRGEWEDEEPLWAKKFFLDGTEIYERIKDGHIVLEHQFSPLETGIGTPAADSGNTGSASFHTNWEGYGGYFTGTDFQRDYVVEILGSGSGVGSEGNIPWGTYKWSRDDGVSWMATTGSCGTDWIHLGSNVYIHWEYEGTGTVEQIAIGDCWTFSARPKFLRITGAAEVWDAREILLR